MTATITDFTDHSIDPERREVLNPVESGYTLPDSKAARLDWVERRPNGQVVQHYAVEDPYFVKLEATNPYAHAYALQELAQVQADFAMYEALLRADQSDAATAAAQEFIYDSSETMKAWRRMFPTAKALYPLQRPDEPVMPNGVFIDNAGYERFAYSLDAVGIRARAVLARNVFIDHARKSAKKQLEWVSLGAGAAIPVFEGLQQIRTTLPDKKVHAYAVDMSGDALAFAHEKSADYDVNDEEFTTLERNLVRDLMYTDKLSNELGKKVDMVDLLGVFEYFPKEKAAVLLRKAFELLADDGILVFGNMLDTHPNLEVNQRGVGWPDIKPRSLEEIQEIITMAGLSLDAATIMVSDDGVYAVVRIEKRSTGPQQAEVEPLEEHGGRVARLVGRAASLFSHHGRRTDLEEAA